MADQSRRDYFDRRERALENEFSSFRAHYKELSEFIQPRRGRFFTGDRNKGDKRYSSIINSQATQAHKIARAGLLAGVMSPTRPWFALATPDPDMMEFQPVKIWLEKVALMMRAIFNSGNLYNMAPAMIGDLLLFGTGVMSHVDDFEDVARFYTHTAGSYLISQNDRFEIDTLVRKFEMTVRQIVSEFGLNKVSPMVKDQWDRGNYEVWYPIVHFIEPNPDTDSRKDLAKFKAFRSIKYEKGNRDRDAFLSESGFDEFPAYVPRWEVTGEDVYGTDCPAMTALGDIKGLQIEEKRKAQAIDKMVNPVLGGPASLKNVPITSLPGGVNLYSADASQHKLEPVYTVNPQLKELMDDISKVERRIGQAFYVDLFMAISNMEGIQPRNQLELAERNGERLLQLGPVLERIHGKDFLDSLIPRTFNQMVRADILPPAPVELQDTSLKIEYISSLAMAQRAVATSSMERLALFASSLVGSGFEGVLDKFDAEQAIDEYAAVIGVPPKLVVPDEVVAERRENQQQQQQIDQALQTGQAGANIVKMASDAKLNDDSVLSRMTE